MLHCVPAAALAHLVVVLGKAKLFTLAVQIA
jgi:hypothetical protein